MPWECCQRPQMDAVSSRLRLVHCHPECASQAADTATCIHERTGMRPALLSGNLPSTGDRERGNEKVVWVSSLQLRRITEQEDRRPQARRALHAPTELLQSIGVAPTAVFMSTMHLACSPRGCLSVVGAAQGLSL